MGEDDDIPPAPTGQEEPTIEEETLTLEQIGEQLLARMDDIDSRLASLEARFSGYSTSDHTHSQTEPPVTREPDNQPQPDRFWFRRLGE